MKSLLRQFIFFALRATFLPTLIRTFIQKDKITILLYHALPAEIFEKHIIALKKHYNIISLADYQHAREDKNFKLPQRALIITFDDGHKSNYELLPIIKKYNIPVTIFLCSSIVGTNRQFWFDILESQKERDALNELSHTQRLKALEEKGFTPTKDYPTPSALSIEQIKEMMPVVDFQAHTRFHPNLPQCDDETANEEITVSKKELLDKFKISTFAFAYPNGDYCERDVTLVKKANFSIAVTTAPFFNTLNTDPLRLKRLNIPEKACVNEVLVKACGLWTFLRLVAGIKRGGRYTPHPRI